jgi:hypothetical protein
MKADFYVLSDDADIDVDTIFEYSLDENLLLTKP